jgi:hypothetical protein
VFSRSRRLALDERCGGPPCSGPAEQARHIRRPGRAGAG